MVDLAKLTYFGTVVLHVLPIWIDYITGDLQAVQPLPRHRPLQGPAPVAALGRGQDAGVGVRLGQLRRRLRHRRDRAPARRRPPEEEHGVHTPGPAGMPNRANHCLLTRDAYW